MSLERLGVESWRSFLRLRFHVISALMPTIIALIVLAMTDAGTAREFGLHLSSDAIIN